MRRSSPDPARPPSGTVPPAGAMPHGSVTSATPGPLFGAPGAWLAASQQAPGRFVGFALLGCSLWLVSLLAFGHAVVGLFD